MADFHFLILLTTVASLSSATSSTASTCAGRNGSLARLRAAVPQPFVDASVKAAFVTRLKSLPARLYRSYAARARAFCAAVDHNTSIPGLVAEAVRAGVVIGEAGIDFSGAMAGERPLLARNDPAFLALCKAYLLDPQPKGSSRFAEAVLRLDFPSHTPSARARRWLAAVNASTRARGLHSQLDRDGYVLVRQWEALDMPAIARVAMDALDAAERQLALSSGALPPVVSAQPSALGPLLLPLLESRDLFEAVSAYLGATAAQPACAYGYNTLRLNHGVSPLNYISSLWHHDRAGRR
jgi:hypothetical protein